jgi:hypothetical protein
MYKLSEIKYGMAYECYKKGIEQGQNPTTEPFDTWFDKNYP